MKSFSQIFSMILPLIYLMAVSINAYIFFARIKKLEKKVILIIIILIIFHSIHIILRGIEIEMFPLVTKFDALSLIAFAIVVLILIVEYYSKNNSTVLFAIFLSYVIQTISSIFYSWHLTPHVLLDDSIFAIHVVLAIFGYAAISISALYAFLYIMLNHNIKHHRLGLFYEVLPPLKHLEKISIQLIKIGIVTLGLGILVGHIHTGRVLGTYWPIDAKVIYNNVIWFGYFFGYLFAQFNNWRGRWMAYLSMVGFIIFILANISLLFIKNTFHQFQ